MTQVRQFWACVSNFITGGQQHNKYLSSSALGASKMGHSILTHALAYLSEQVEDESHFNAYHFAIGDTSFQSVNQQEFLSLGDLRAAMKLRFPNCIDGHNYLSLEQKEELVEFAYAAGLLAKIHCLGLLAPGQGKSECYLTPTIASQLRKTIIHVAPYSFLAAYQFANASSVFDKVGLGASASTVMCTGKDITQGSLLDALLGKENLPSLLFLNVNAVHNFFAFHLDLFKSWADVVDSRRQDRY